MSLYIEQLPGEPLILASLVGKATPDMIYELYAATARVADEYGHAYRITDVDHLDASFCDLVEVLAVVMHGKPGSPSDERVFSVIVSSDPLACLYAEGLHQEQYGTRNVPLFTSHDEAVAYLRRQMAQAA